MKRAQAPRFVRSSCVAVASHGSDHQDQLTVVSSRLAALSSASRVSCQGVC